MRAQEQRERHMEAQVGEAKAGRAATSRALSAVSAERDATLQRLNQVQTALTTSRRCWVGRGRNAGVGSWKGEQWGRKGRVVVRFRGCEERFSVGG